MLLGPPTGTAINEAVKQGLTDVVEYLISKVDYFKNSLKNYHIFHILITFITLSDMSCLFNAPERKVAIFLTTKMHSQKIAD